MKGDTGFRDVDLNILFRIVTILEEKLKVEIVLSLFYSICKIFLETSQKCEGSTFVEYFITRGF